MKLSIDLISGVTKVICQKVALHNKKDFIKNLDGLRKLNFQSKHTFDVISMTGSREFEEQLISIYSYLFAVGSPLCWYVYSDGSLSEEQCALLKDHFDFVKVLNWNNFSSESTHNKFIEEYLKVIPVAAKKVAVITCHSYRGPTIFCDSDILFYSSSKRYFNMKDIENNFWYMADVGWGTLDEALKSKFEMYQLNFGFLILNKSFDFSPVFDYLYKLETFSYFSDQSAFHIAFCKNKGKVLDPRKFVISTDDQFTFGYSFDPQEIAIRHYITPVRHKMWQKTWKWHFLSNNNGNII